MGDEAVDEDARLCNSVDRPAARPRLMRAASHSKSPCVGSAGLGFSTFKRSDQVLRQARCRVQAHAVHRVGTRRVEVGLRTIWNDHHYALSCISSDRLKSDRCGLRISSRSGLDGYGMRPLLLGSSSSSKSGMLVKMHSLKAKKSRHAQTIQSILQ